MEGPDRHLRRAIAGVAILTLIACSSAPEPEVGEWQTQAMDEIEKTKEAAGEGSSAEIPLGPTDPAEVAAEAQAATAQPPVNPTAPVHFGTTSADEQQQPEPTLFEAAQAERRRRELSPQPTLVITDENLKDYAKGGQLTEMVTEGTGTEDEASESLIATASPTSQESYWRTRVRDSRLAWRAAADRADELEKEVAQLRFDFYASDDGVYRDNEIKPAWDRAVVELAQARMREQDLETQVELVQSEGLDAGALPGWLREGIDFEPERPEEVDDNDDLTSAEVIEPPILEDPPQ